jgi:hypothetical protein
MTPVITPTAAGAIAEQYPKMLHGGEPIFVVGFFVAILAVVFVELAVWRRRR